MTEEASAALEEDDGVIIETGESQEETTPEPDTAEVTAASDAEVSSEEPPKEVDEKQKALNRLAFEKREEKRRADGLEERLKKFEAELHKKPTDEPVMPDEADFDYDPVKYRKALSEYQENMVDYRLDKRLAEQETQREQAKKQVQQREIQETWNKKVSESKIVGFADSVQNLPQLHPEVLDVLMMTDNGPKVAYYLSQHLDEADTIALSSPVTAALRIGQLSARLATKQKVTTTSAAPEPIDPLKQSGANLGGKDDPLIAGATFT